MRYFTREPEFLNAPYGFAAGDTNLFRYVGNRATTATDPSGLAPPGLRAPVPTTKVAPDGGPDPANDEKTKKALAKEREQYEKFISEFKDLAAAEREDFLARERQRVWAERYPLKNGAAGSEDVRAKPMYPYADKWFEKEGFGNGELVALMLEQDGREAQNVLWRAEKLGLKLEPYPSAWWTGYNKVTYLDAVEGRKIEYRTDKRLKWIADEMFKSLKNNVKDEWLEGLAKNVGLRGRHGGLLKDVDPEMEAQLEELDQLWAAEVKFACNASAEYFKDRALDYAGGWAQKLAIIAAGATFAGAVNKAKRAAAQAREAELLLSQGTSSFQRSGKQWTVLDRSGKVVSKGDTQAEALKNAQDKLSIDEHATLSGELQLGLKSKPLGYLDNAGEYLKSLGKDALGKSHPPGGKIGGETAHAHHIVMQVGMGAEGKLATKEAQAILWKQGINPFRGGENLVWAPMIGYPGLLTGWGW